jgi:YD repeat-containing protein
LGACHTIEVDPIYAEFVVKDHSFTGEISLDGCGENLYTTTAVYDRGLALPLSVTSPRGQPSSVLYDGFGRVIASYGPSASSPGNIDPQHRALYEYVPPGDADTTPFSSIRTQSIHENPNGSISYVEDVVYVDGLGRTIYAISEADPDKGDKGKYIVAGGALYNAKGTRYLSHEPFFGPGPAIGFPIGTQPTTATKWQKYDAFGRVKEVYLQDNQLKSRAVYHALSGDSYDAGDLSDDSTYKNTFSTQISDGHGRTVASISRFRVDGSTTVEEHRTNTTYVTNQRRRDDTGSAVD